MALLGIGEWGVRVRTGETLSTSVLGVRVALLLHCPSSGAVAMAHVALPRSSAAHQQALLMPAYYADTALAALLDGMERAGAGDPAGFRVKIAGGDTLRGPAAEAGGGLATAEAIKAALRERGLSLAGADLGGGRCRTLTLEAGSGRVTVSLASGSPASW